MSPGKIAAYNRASKFFSVIGLGTDLGALDASKAVLESDVATLQAEMSTAQTDIGTLQTDVSALQAMPGISQAARVRPIAQGFFAVGSYNLLDNVNQVIVIPAKTAIYLVYAVVTEQFASAGGLATVAFGSEASGDLLPAALVGALSPGIISVFPGPVLIGGVNKSLTMDVAVEDLTAGKIDIYLLELAPLTA